MTTSKAASAHDLTTRLHFALRVAREASDLILGYYQTSDLAVERKGDSSPVTEADKRSELLIRERLAVWVREYAFNSFVSSSCHGRHGNDL